MVEGIDFVAIADIRPDLAGQMAGDFGVNAYGDADEMLQAEAPDLVAVCTKEKPRCKLCLLCAERGVKAVVAEKPMAASVEEARTMVGTFEEKGARLVVSHQMRFSDEFIAARESLWRGDIGDPYFVRACSYGQLMEQGPHMVDMLLYLLDEPAVDWVMSAVADLREGLTAVHPAPAFAVGYVAFKNGVRAELECGRYFPPAIGYGPELDGATWLQKRVQVFGTQGMLDAIVRHSCRLLKSGAGWRTLAEGPQGWDNATLNFYRELVQVERSGGTHRNDARVSLHGFEIIHGMYRSALIHERVPVPVPGGIDPLAEIMAHVE